MSIYQFNHGLCICGLVAIMATPAELHHLQSPTVDTPGRLSYHFDTYGDSAAGIFLTTAGTNNAPRHMDHLQDSPSARGQQSTHCFGIPIDANLS